MQPAISSDGELKDNSRLISGFLISKSSKKFYSNLSHSFASYSANNDQYVYLIQKLPWRGELFLV